MNQDRDAFDWLFQLEAANDARTAKLAESATKLSEMTDETLLNLVGYVAELYPVPLETGSVDAIARECMNRHRKVVKNSDYRFYSATHGNAKFVKALNEDHERIDTLNEQFDRARKALDKLERRVMSTTQII